MKFSFRPKIESTNWDEFLGPKPSETRKQRLLRECQELDVSIHLDDEGEFSSGLYGELRGVASEAELERRLLAKKTVSKAARSNIISILALIVSVASFITTIYLSRGP